MAGGRPPVFRSLVAIWLAGMVVGGPVLAETLIVGRLDDPPLTSPPTSCDTAGQACSLRAAIFLANTSTEPTHEILLEAGKTFTLNLTGELDSRDLDVMNVAGTATIVRSTEARKVATITAAESGRLFEVFESGNLTLQDVVAEGGNADVEPADACAGRGGGICVRGTLRLVRSTLAASKTTADGGGIWSSGTVMVEESSVAQNTSKAQGGGIATSGGSLLVHDSTIGGNTSVGVGAGILLANGATLDLARSTLSGNSATAAGGGIALASAGTAQIRNVTLSGNKGVGGANGRGGGVAIVQTPTATVTINNSTITKNTAGDRGGGIYSPGDGTIEVSNSILAGNTVGTTADDCAGPMVSHGYNIVQQPGPDCVAGKLDLAVDPKLGVLAANLGPRGSTIIPPQTHALLPGDSRAIDAGNPDPDGPFACEKEDETGYPRPQNGGTAPRCDIGAFELEPDTDGDGVRDRTDNCTTLKNASQRDRDQDQIGDDCDTCPGVRNKNDGGDDDADGVLNVNDCCPTTAVSGAQLDCLVSATAPTTPRKGSKKKHPGISGCAVSDLCGCETRACSSNAEATCDCDPGQVVPWNGRKAWKKCIRKKGGKAFAACVLNDGGFFLCGRPLPPGDDDPDADGVTTHNANINLRDNCDTVYNPRQCDADNDGRGDACDNDLDNDGVPNDQDLCPSEPPADGIPCKPPRPDAECHKDTDHDEVGDDCDNCPGIANESQSDLDHDGRGDACDNCKKIAGDDQADTDNDGIGDACDCCPNSPEGTHVNCIGCAPLEDEHDRTGHCNRGNCED
jgi:predicted outer membrane repeat protein